MSPLDGRKKCISISNVKISVGKEGITHACRGRASTVCSHLNKCVCMQAVCMGRQPTILGVQELLSKLLKYGTEIPGKKVALGAAWAFLPFLFF